ncbi:MAG: tetratricopeptide repeat protein [Methermicoccaceae archaeon]
MDNINEIIEACSKAIASSKTENIDVAIQELEDIEAELEEELMRSFVVEKKAGLLVMANRYEEAIPLYEEIMTIQAQAVEEDAPMAAGMLSTTFYNFGSALYEMGQYHAAEEAYNASLDILQQLSEEEGEEKYAADLEGTFYHLGCIAQEQGEFDLANERYLEALEAFDKLPEEEHTSTDILMVAGVLNNIGVIEAQQDRLEGAEGLFAEASELYGTSQEEDARFYSASTLRSLAMVRIELGKQLEAMQAYSDAISIIKSLVENNPVNQTYQEMYQKLIFEIENVKDELEDMGMNLER